MRTRKKRRREVYRGVVEELAVYERCRDRAFGVVLDFGCGTGRFSSYFSRMGSRVIGIEVQRRFLNQARVAHRDDNVLFIWYGGGVLPIRNGAVNLVLAVGVIRSLMDRGPLGFALNEWHRCLGDGGNLLLIETDNRALRRYMRSDELRRAIKTSGFETIVWYPMRKVSSMGLRLVKWGIIPKGGYPHLARWELWSRRHSPWRYGKRAYLGEFRKIDHD
jgi:SAM-dependent methyltransferase